MALNQKLSEELLTTLKYRFEKNMHRHKGLEWTEIAAKLDENPEKLWSLQQMEQTGGEPDVVWYDESSDTFTFCDCSPQSPDERRKICYDREALKSRKKYPPDHNAVDMATEMGIELLTESVYKKLQELGPFDTKTSSWLHTQEEVRELGGALFGDYRFGRAFIYHNGADSYYGVRGFRGLLNV